MRPAALSEADFEYEYVEAETPRRLSIETLPSEKSKRRRRCIIACAVIALAAVVTVMVTYVVPPHDASSNLNRRLGIVDDHPKQLASSVTTHNLHLRDAFSSGEESEEQVIIVAV